MKNLLLASLTLVITSNLFAQSDSSQLYFKKGMDEKNARRYLVASKFLEKATQFDPSNIEAWMENGRVNLEMRRIDAAQANFLKAYELQPSNVAALRELTALYFNNRQFQKAIDLGQKCNCSEGERIIGMSNYHLEDYGSAIKGLQRFLSKNPNDAEAAYTLGRSYLEIEDYRNAIAPYQKAVTLDPTRTSWMYELGLIFYNQNNFKDAVKYFKMADDGGYIKANDFYENAGFAYLSIGDVDNGMKYLNIILKRKPNNKELLTNIAQAFYSAKKYKEALDFYQKLLENDPKDARALYMAGITFQKLGDKAKGQQMCDKAIEMEPALAKNRQKQEMPFGL